MVGTAYVDDTHVVAKLDGIGPGIRQALEDALAPRAAKMADDARARAAEHIHFLGAKNPGSYLASIKGGVASKEKRVVGYLRSGHPLAHLLEFGAHTPPHMIRAQVADFLQFEGDAGAVYAKYVNNPGANIPAYPALGPAFEVAKPEIEATIMAIVENVSHKW